MNDKLKAIYFQELESFLGLPRMVQEMIWLDLVEDRISGKDLTTFYNLSNYGWCESPIEVIFAYFFDRVAFYNYKNLGFNITPQEEIITSKKTYRVDFLIECYEYRFDEDFKESKPPDEYYSQVIVECDGHDFHEKTKEQVKRRNQRDLDLKMEGYDLIHFSGSEIYNEPEQCAINTIEYLIKQLKPSWEG